MARRDSDFARYRSPLRAAFDRLEAEIDACCEQERLVA
jgi:hypothetical protein